MSTSPENTRAITLPTAQSTRRRLTPRYWARKPAISSGSSVQASSCGTATRTVPRCKSLRLPTSLTTPSRSCRIFSICGYSSRPVSDRRRRRVLRSNRRRPRVDSSSLIGR